MKQVKSDEKNHKKSPHYHHYPASGTTNQARQV